jgi:hypothetical protein
LSIAIAQFVLSVHENCNRAIPRESDCADGASAAASAVIASAAFGGWFTFEIAGAGLWFDKELLGCGRVASDLSKVPLGGMRAVKRRGSQVNRW